MTYFRRALKLSRHYLSAWTLMGHEYVEMKNPPAAIGDPSIFPSATVPGLLLFTQCSAQACGQAVIVDHIQHCAWDGCLLTVRLCGCWGDECMHTFTLMVEVAQATLGTTSLTYKPPPSYWILRSEKGRWDFTNGFLGQGCKWYRASGMLAEAYRKAVELNPRDYRAWYGLGQTYELLHMPVYALHYYQRATQVPCVPQLFQACAIHWCYSLTAEIPLELCHTTVMWGPNLESCQAFKTKAQQIALTGFTRESSQDCMLCQRMTAS